MAWCSEGVQQDQAEQGGTRMMNVPGWVVPVVGAVEGAEVGEEMAVGRIGGRGAIVEDEEDIEAVLAVVGCGGKMLGQRSDCRGGQSGRRVGGSHIETPLVRRREIEFSLETCLFHGGAMLRA